MSRYLVDQIERNDLIEVVKHSQVVELHGDRELEAVTIADTRLGRAHSGPPRGRCSSSSAPHRTPSGSEDQLATDRAGFLLTGRDIQDDDLAEYDGDRPLFLETSRPGIFAVGDVHSGSIKRVASAVGEGSMAVRADPSTAGRAGWSGRVKG